MSDRSLYEPYAKPVTGGLLERLLKMGVLREAVPCRHGNYAPHQTAIRSGSAKSKDWAFNVTHCDGKP